MQWRNSNTRWGWMAILLHWLTAGVVIGLFLLGDWMVELTYYDPWYKTAPWLHKSSGVLLFVLTVARLLWRSGTPSPAPLASHTPLERRAASTVHHLLYLLLVAVMLSGYLISSADGRGIEVFGWFEVPATLHGIAQQEEIAGTIHRLLTYTLIAVALLHALAALKHHFFDKDRTLKRMLGL